MTPLNKAIASLFVINPLFFGGMYVPYSLEGYDPNYDEVSLVIIATEETEQHALSLCIQPYDTGLRTQSFYLLEVSYFDQMRCSGIIPGHLILDFLLYARLYVVSELKTMVFEYPGFWQP